MRNDMIKKLVSEKVTYEIIERFKISKFSNSNKIKYIKFTFIINGKEYTNVIDSQKMFRIYLPFTISSSYFCYCFGDKDEDVQIKHCEDACKKLTNVRFQAYKIKDEFINLKLARLIKKNINNAPTNKP